MNMDQIGLTSLRDVGVTVLSDVRVGGSGTLERIDLPEDISDHLAHLGFLPGAAFEVLRRAPAGDPTVYRVDGLEVGLRHETACRIEIEDDLAPSRVPAVSAGEPVEDGL